MQQENTQEKHRPPRRSVPPPPPPALSALVAHVLATLPDSLARRAELLQALAACIPPGEGSGLWVRTLQFHLQEHQRLRLDWPQEADQG
jgi:hypothetical protein